MKQTKVTKSARGEPCSLRIPGVCLRHEETVVLCHVGKGTAKRNDDWFAVYGCMACHQWIDGAGVKTEDWPYRDTYVLDALRETQGKLIEKGLIILA